MVGLEGFEPPTHGLGNTRTTVHPVRTHDFSVGYSGSHSDPTLQFGHEYAPHYAPRPEPPKSTTNGFSSVASWTMNGQPARVPIFGENGLSHQLGTAQYSVDRLFRHKIVHWLGQVKLLWPQCPAQVSDDGRFVVVQSARKSAALHPVERPVNPRSFPRYSESRIIPSRICHFRPGPNTGGVLRS